MRNHQMAAVMILVQAGTGDCVSGPKRVLTWRPGCENQRQSLYAADDDDADDDDDDVW